MSTLLFTPAQWLTEHYGDHVGLNADWSAKAWHVRANIFIVDDEKPEGTYSVVRRTFDPQSEENADADLFTGDVTDCLAFVTTHKGWPMPDLG